MRLSYTFFLIGLVALFGCGRTFLSFGSPPDVFDGANPGDSDASEGDPRGDSLSGDEGSGLGAPCTSNETCQSDFCADGVCCSQECLGPCMACSVNGQCEMPADDEACGEIDCDLLDTACRDYHDLTTQRCKALGVCRQSRIQDCDDFTDASGGPCGTADSCLGPGVCAAGACVQDQLCFDFVDVSAGSGLITLGPNHGVAWQDYDSDGDLDVAIGGEGIVYEQMATGSFEARLAFSVSGIRGVSFGDADNDGDLDLVVTAGIAPISFFENRGDGVWVERAAAAGLSSANLGSTAWLDVNRDGNSDLFVPNGADPYNVLFLNQVDHPTTFSEVAGSGVGLGPGSGNGEGCAVADIDNDGDVDVWYQDAADGSLYVNQGDGTFVENSAGAGLAFDMGGEPPYTAAVFADVDDDGFADLFIGHPTGKANRLYLNNQDGTFRLSPDLNEDVGQSGGAAWGDIDLDGDLDLLVGNTDSPDCLYSRQADGSFLDVAASVGIADVSAWTQNVALVDFDGDGDLDISLCDSLGADHLLRNELESTNFLRVFVQGAGAGGAPRDGSGTRVELWDVLGATLLASRQLSGGGGFAGQEPLVAHFGLAAAWGGARGTYLVRVFFQGQSIPTQRLVVPAQEQRVMGEHLLLQSIQVVQ